MPLLYPNLRISQIFGDVGKTLLTTTLVRSSALQYTGSHASAPGAPSKRVFYLKPVSTGPDAESDVSYVERHTKAHSGAVSTRNLYQYREPMSPHLAAQLAPDLPFPKSNDELVRGVAGYAEECVGRLKGSQGALYVETAGGVHSPALHPPYTQSTSLLPLRLPSVLIGAPQLGGISTTISAYESLHLRGYKLSAVLCLEHDYYRNHEFLREYFTERGVRFWSLPAPPERHGTAAEDAQRLGQWYAGIEREGQGAREAARWLDQEHEERMRELEGMPRRTLDSVWWPFTQHGIINKVEDVMVVDSAQGDNFDAYYAPSPSSPSSYTGSLLNPYFDGAASWFTQSHGHAAEPLTLAAAHAAGRYGHVLFPSGTNAPALELAEALKETAGKGWADRVFYSDNGSTGTEVALKMAIRAAGRRYGWEGTQGEKVGVIGLKGGYHGDTIGSMDATEASTFNDAVDWYQGRGYWFSPPAVQVQNGKPVVTLPADLDLAIDDASSASADYSITPGTSSSPALANFPSLASIYDLAARRSSPLATQYRASIRATLEARVKGGYRFGAVMIEPTCLGAGGMIFVDPLFQACLVEVVRASGDLFGSAGAEGAGQGYESELEQVMASVQHGESKEWRGLPIIYDEVFSGLHRFGYHTASSVLSHHPDIAVYAKILTGGLLPLAATLASRSIFEAFLSDRKVDALLHGHSYTAHPVGCAVALKAIEMVRDVKWEKERAMWGDVEADTAMGASSGSGRAASEVGVGAEGGSEMVGRWSFWSPDFVRAASETQGVRGVMAMGTVCAIELDDAEGGYSSHKALDFLTALRSRRIEPITTGGSQTAGVSGLDTDSDPFTPFQIHSRPLGNVLYFMTSLFTRSEVVRAMEGGILAQLRESA